MNTHPNSELIRVSLQDLAGTSVWIEGEEDLTLRKSEVLPEVQSLLTEPGEKNIWIEEDEVPGHCSAKPSTEKLPCSSQSGLNETGVTNLWLEDERPLDS